MELLDQQQQEDQRLQQANAQMQQENQQLQTTSTLQQQEIQRLRLCYGRFAEPDTAQLE